MIMRTRVQTQGQALAYIADCTLATVASMALSKTQRKRGEFKRQKSIAQTAVDWMREFGISDPGSRADEIIRGGVTVDDWAAQFVGGE